jgi:nicotinate-nucleotide pyrophosphorylase (carboxylating)
VSKAPGVIAGLPLVKSVFDFRKYPGEFKPKAKEGGNVHPGEVIYCLVARTRHILECERIILNFLQRLSGIATSSRAFSKAADNGRTKVLDSRKTLPGFRMLDKYAVRVGGAVNHRMGLYDAVLIKDNHIQACGSPGKAVESVRKRYGRKYSIEIEISTLEQLSDALKAGPDWVMLDNMGVDKMGPAIALVRQASPEIRIEVSGNVTLPQIKKLADLNIDYVSVGALTHSVKALDISLKFKGTFKN